MGEYSNKKIQKDIIERIPLSDIESITYDKDKNTITFNLYQKNSKEFKDGDIVFIKTKSGKECIAIYHNTDITDNVSLYLLLYGNDTLLAKEIKIPEGTTLEEYRLATEGETDKLFRAISKKGFIWDSKNKQIKRWRAKKGEIYYTISSHLHITRMRENGDPYDNEKYKYKNYSKTPEGLALKQEKIDRILKGNDYDEIY